MSRASLCRQAEQQVKKCQNIGQIAALRFFEHVRACFTKAHTLQERSMKSPRDEYSNRINLYAQHSAQDTKTV